MSFTGLAPEVVRSLVDRSVARAAAASVGVSRRAADSIPLPIVTDSDRRSFRSSRTAIRLAGMAAWPRPWMFDLSIPIAVAWWIREWKSWLVLSAALIVAASKIRRALVSALLFYPKARMFIWTHAGGFCRRGDRSARKAACDQCKFRTIGGRGVERCKGGRGGNHGCGGCPKWYATRLSWLRRLKRFRCPRGKF